MDTQDFERFTLDAAANDVREPGDDPFSRAFEPARATHVGMLFEPKACRRNMLGYSKTSNGIILRDVIDRWV